MQEELKECPFCGSDQAVMKYNGAKHGRFYYIECEICGGRTRGVCRPFRDIPNDDPNEWDNRYAHTAITLWNQRSEADA